MHHWLANSADYCEKQNVLTQYYHYPSLLEFVTVETA